jgi:hypothetical protein
MLHALLFVPTLWGTTLHKRQLPNDPGAAASRNVKKDQDSMMVVFVDDSNAIQDTSDANSDEALKLDTPALLPVAAPQIPAAADLDPVQDEKNDPITAEADGDQAGHAMMFGRYMGQISARVERAWLRPRTPLGTHSFNCRVQILQDRRGNVQEVTVQRCSDDLRWQATLIQAIQAASPFPAPPDPAVFSNLITLEFDSEPFKMAGSEQGFERQ